MNFFPSIFIMIGNVYLYFIIVFWIRIKYFDLNNQYDNVVKFTHPCFFPLTGNEYHM